MAEVKQRTKLVRVKMLPPGNKHLPLPLVEGKVVIMLLDIPGDGAFVTIKRGKDISRFSKEYFEDV